MFFAWGTAGSMIVPTHMKKWAQLPHSFLERVDFLLIQLVLWVQRIILKNVPYTYLYFIINKEICEENINISKGHLFNHIASCEQQEI